MIGLIKKTLFKIGVQHKLSLRRLRWIDRRLGGQLLKTVGQNKTLLDIGCQRGKDLVTFLKDRQDLHIIGLDLKDYGLRQDNFSMVIGDASHLPFKSAAFDISTSIGVFEHITPIVKLARAIREIERVSTMFAVVVPSISTIIEPHTHHFFWQLKDRRKKRKYSGPGPLIHMSDEAWKAFIGFKHTQTKRYWHIPLLVNNLVIYKK
jgi:2-polyprenyl-3-methyl-5-hydroxy-6-metoxy-1,4-benzoquinol methylase